MSHSATSIDMKKDESLPDSSYIPGAGVTEDSSLPAVRLSSNLGEAPVASNQPSIQPPAGIPPVEGQQRIDTRIPDDSPAPGFSSTHGESVKGCALVGVSLIASSMPTINGSSLVSNLIIVWN